MGYPTSSNKIKVFEAVIEESRVEEGSLEVSTRKGRIRLRRFQEEVLARILENLRGGGEARRLVIVSAPTGSGKTIVPLLPYLFYHIDPKRAYELFYLYEPWSSAAIYPSRELLEDQHANMARLLDMIADYIESPGEDYCLLSKLSEQGIASIYDSGNSIIVLLKIHGESTDIVRNSYIEFRGVRGAGKLEALIGVSEELRRFMMKNNRPLFQVWLTTLEYLSLLLEGLYGDWERLGGIVRRVAEQARNSSDLAGLLDSLANITWREARGLGPRRHRDMTPQAMMLKSIYHGLVFIDEAHLYDGPSRLNLAILVSLLLALSPPYTQVVMSSATHSRELARALEESIQALLGIEPARIDEEGGQSGVVVRKKTRLIILGVKPGKPLPASAQVYAAQALLPEIVKLSDVSSMIKEAVRDGRTVLILADRLYWLRMTAKEVFRSVGVKPVCVDSLARKGIIPDYCDPPANVREPGRIIIGSSSISYGIDIPSADIAIVYGKTPSDIIQRIGRTGRRPGDGEAIVYLVTGKKVAQKITRTLGTEPATLAELRKALEQAMDARDRQDNAVQIWLAKATAIAGSIIVTMLLTLAEDAKIVLKDLPVRVAEALKRAAGAENRRVEGRALRLLASLGNLDASLLPSFAMPRLIVTAKTPLGEVGLHQFLRLCPCSTLKDPLSCAGDESYDRYEILLEVDEDTYRALVSAFRERVTTLGFLVDYLDSLRRQELYTGRISLDPTQGRRSRRATLMQLSSTPGGVFHVDCDITMLQAVVGNSLTVLLDYGEGNYVAANKLLNLYYTAPSIPVVASSGEATSRDYASLPETLARSTRLGVILFLGG